MDNPALLALEQAKAALNEATAAAKDPKVAARQKPDKEGKLPAERAQAELARASKQLQDQAELREQNPLTNTDAALDTNRASRAAEKLRQDTAMSKEAASFEATKQRVTDLEKATRVLDADSLAKESIAALNEAAMAAQDQNADQARAVAESRAASG